MPAAFKSMMRSAMFPNVISMAMHPATTAEVFSFGIIHRAVITNCMITNNTGEWGGGVSFYENSPEVVNCTIADNHATQEGGGISAYSASPRFVNCIIWGNTADSAEPVVGLRGSGSAPDPALLRYRRFGMSFNHRKLRNVSVSTSILDS